MWRFHRFAWALLIFPGPGMATAAQDAAGRVSAETARELQWLYRARLGSGAPEPTAIFLSWDYSAVVFTATCDRRRRELVLRYHLPAEWEQTHAGPMEIASGTATVPLRTIRRDRILEGRTRLSSQLVRVLGSQGDLEITASNEMEEPWYVGRAGPLRRLVRSCGRRSLSTPVRSLNR